MSETRWLPKRWLNTRAKQTPPSLPLTLHDYDASSDDDDDHFRGLESFHDNPDIQVSDQEKDGPKYKYDTKECTTRAE